MLILPETTDQGVDAAYSCNCHCLCLGFLSVARIRSGYVTIAQDSGLGIGVGRFSRPLRGVGELTILDAGLDTTRPVQTVCVVPLRAGVLRLL
jgi:hypothetical protein